MNLPMSWLNDYMDIDVTPKEYADRLTMTGSKVEGYEGLGENIQNVVVGKVLTCEDHPDSDHLHVCTVDAGTGEALQIVCGAPNVKAGIKTPVALVGAQLPDGKIKKGKIRGVESRGMLCSHEELGISEDILGFKPEYGILILPDDAEIGKDIRDIYGLNDTIVEFEITSNRPDCFSIIGLARETAVSFNKKLTIPVPVVHENSESISDTISVEVRNPEKCLRYCARMVKNVKIGPSPSWMVRRLKACGVRSINNIVDITNYVLLEYGQPMHAFDLRDLSGAKIIVRDALDGEVIKTLDEQDRTLNHNDLVISDSEKAVAIAGVMGGFNSEVKDDTATVIFESATFEASTVRLTAQKIGLRTESSSRYEKGLDANNTVGAVNRACELVEMLGCGEIVGGMIDIKGNIPDPATIAFRPDKINAFLGTDIPTETMAEYFRSLEIKVDTDNMTLTAPSFRPDLVAEADFAEEAARFYGYDRIPTTLLSGEATCGRRTPVQAARDEINRLLTAQGMYEIYTYTFAGPSDFDKLRIAKDSPLRNAVKITNPLGEDTSLMRTNTLSSMLDTLARNYNHRNSEAKLFEIGKRFIPTTSGNLPVETEIITLGMYGDVDFFDLKGICENMFENMYVNDVEFTAKSDNPTFHSGRTAKITAEGEEIGIIGQIHPLVARAYGIGTDCYAAMIELDKMLSHTHEDVKYTALPKFPAVTRDIAVLVDKDVPVAEIRKIIIKSSKKLLEETELFDVYEGERIPEGKKSVAYNIKFRAADRSLTNDEINVVFDKIVRNLETELNAQLR